MGAGKNANMKSALEQKIAAKKDFEQVLNEAKLAPKAEPKWLRKTSKVNNPLYKVNHGKR